MEKIKVSVIVPVYNAGKNLEKNLFFLSIQTLKEIEIILVNDASTDESLDIMTAYKIAFPDKFKVVTYDKNGGPGKARNAGLKYAKGEYIGFVDSDDFVSNEMFELLYNKAKEKDSDLVMCAYRHKKTSTDFLIDTDKFENTLNRSSRTELMTYIGFLWHSIFKKSIVDNMNMWFTEEYMHQDIGFLAEFYCRANTIDFVHKSLYLYIYSTESASHKGRPLVEYMNIAQRNIDCTYKRCQNTPYYNDAKDALEYIFFRLSGSWLEAIVAYDTVTKETVKTYNDFIKQYIPNFWDNKVIADKAKSDELLAAYNTDDMKFKENLVIYKEKRIKLFS